MKVYLKFFSVLRDYFKTSEKIFELDQPMRAQQIFLKLFQDEQD